MDIRNIMFSYGSVPVLKDVSAAAESGKVTAIAGPNGVGKTTLLRCLAHLSEPDSGEVMFGGVNLLKRGVKEMARIQAYVPQSTALSFPLTVDEFVSLGRRPYIDWKLKEEDREIIDRCMKYMGVECFAGTLLDELSGGQRQKVALTRALVQEPKILLLDEPTSALDVKNQLEVMRILRNIAREQDCVVLAVMHDLSLIERFADSTILLSGGRVVASGPTEETLVPGNIKEAYGVNAIVLDTDKGKVIVPYEG